MDLNCSSTDTLNYAPVIFGSSVIIGRAGASPLVARDMYNAHARATGKPAH